jgi:hypothetical protein
MQKPERKLRTNDSLNEFLYRPCCNSANELQMADCPAKQGKNLLLETAPFCN